MHARSLAAILAAVALAPALAGCASPVGDAAKEISEAKSALEDARAEYREMKERYDRVRSLTIVREEVVDLTLVPRYDAGSRTLAFDPVATRDGVDVPPENLTRLPLVAVSFADRRYDVDPESVTNVNARCDPLSCSLVVPADGAAFLAWDADGAFAWQVLANGTLLAHSGGAWTETSAADWGFRLPDARVGATTSAGAATD